MSSAQPPVALLKRSGAFDTWAPLDLATLIRPPRAIAPKSCGIGAMIAAVAGKQGVRFRTIVETCSIAALKAIVQSDMAT